MMTSVNSNMVRYEETTNDEGPKKIIIKNADAEKKIKNTTREGIIRMNTKVYFGTSYFQLFIKRNP